MNNPRDAREIEKLQMIRRLAEQLTKHGHDLGKTPVWIGPTDKERPTEIECGRLREGASAEIIYSTHGLAVNERHGTTFYDPDGRIRHRRLDGFTETRNPQIDRIEIRDIRAIASASISRTGDCVSQTIQFVDGGTFSCLFETDGSASELLIRNVTLNWRDEDRVLVVHGPEGSPRARKQQR